MVDLLHSSPAFPTSDRNSGLSQDVSQGVPQDVPQGQLEAGSLSSEVASYMVFQLDQPLLVVEQAALKQSPRWVALQQLVNLLTELRSPQAECPIEQPLTPEILAAYVEEEVAEVVQAWSIAQKPPSQIHSQQHYWLKDLAPQLLWGIACGGYSVMRLLEGQAATVALGSKKKKQTGIVRLVAALNLQTPTLSTALDLATYQPVPPVLSPQAQIQLQNSAEATSLSASAFLQQIHDQIQCYSPAIVPWLQGITAPLLLPHQSWQSAGLQLQLSLEFIPSLAVAPVPGSTPRVKITQSNWLKDYRANLTQQQWLKTLLSLEGQGQGRWLKADTPPDASTLVKAACEMGDRLQTAATLEDDPFLQQLGLGALASRLQWRLMQTAYEVMQCMSGIQATLLPPQSQPQTGTLRFSVVLQVQTPEQDWCFDLATGCLTNSPLPSLPQDTIVQSQEIAELLQPRRLQDLETSIWQKIDAMAPELRSLSQGIEIDLAAHHEDWQPGIMQWLGCFTFR